MKDTGLEALFVIASYYKIPLDRQQIERAYKMESSTLDSVSIVRAAIDLKLKSRLYTGIDVEKIKHMVFPAVIRMNDGNYFVVMGINDDKLYVIDSNHGGDIVEADKDVFLADWTGEIILFAKRFLVDETFKTFGFSWFIPTIMKYGRHIRSVFFISLVMQLLSLASPIFMQVIIDKVLVHRSTSTLDVLLVGMILTQLFNIWMTALRTYLFNNVTIKMDVLLSSHLFKNIMRLPLSYFNKWQVGDIVSRTGELENLRNFITGSSLSIVLDIIFALVYIAVMIYYSTKLSVVVLLTMPLFVLLNLVVAPLYKAKLNEKFLIDADNRSFLIETITGINTVKATCVEKNFVERYENILARYVQSVFSVVQLANIANCLGSFIQQMFNLSILWLGAIYVMDGELSVGELIAFQMMAGYFITPIMRLVNMWQYFQQTKVSMDRLGDIMNAKLEPAFNPNRTTLTSIKGEITLDNLVFSYGQDSKLVINNVSIRIGAGAKVGIVGRSGSGKSTLTKLIQRLYVPTEGRILIDGVDIAQVEPAWLRRQVGVVLQDTPLFSGTIKENIMIACPSATEEKVHNAAILSGADEFITTLPHGYDNFVGERGCLLSGGQRQRIAIARALITNPRILIFDEATSALDYESESIIMNNIGKIAAGRTLLMIAHRLETVKNCDAIIVMDRGRIVEVGSHSKLLEQKGLYYTLYMAQQ